jgi:recombinational DNA repair protein (RecF pathway)
MPEIYELLTGAIAAIAASRAPAQLLPRFSLRLLAMLGLAPPLGSCVRCGNALPLGPAWLDAQTGGLVDGACRERWQDLPELGERDLESLRALARPKSPQARLHATPRAAAAVEELISHHLGKRPKALAQLDALGG